MVGTKSWKSSEREEIIVAMESGIIVFERIRRLHVRPGRVSAIP